MERATRLGIDAEMHHLSGVPNDHVPIWLNASDVVLLTSLHEGSPTIIKEALACNRPVVSVDVGDVRERIRGVDGCFLARPDPTTWPRSSISYTRVHEASMVDARSKNYRWDVSPSA